MAPVIEKIGKPVKLSEGPFWDEGSQSLYFVDIPNGTIHKYNPQTKKQSCAKPGKGGGCSIIIPIEGQKDTFVVSEADELHVITWDGESDEVESDEVLLKLDQVDAGSIINDCKVDPNGRLWAGTLGPIVETEPAPEKGALFRINTDKSVSKQLTNVTMSNGLAWSPDKTKFYYIDTIKYRVDSYDYDNGTGNLSNEKTVFDLKENKIVGMPDGMTIDVEGNLWITVFGGSRVLRVDPTTGKLLSSIEFPTRQITSCCFGGHNYDELYVTTGNIDYNGEKSGQHPHAGGLFKVSNLGVKGSPSLAVKL